MYVSLQDDAKLIVIILASYMLEYEYDYYENEKACNYLMKSMYYLMKDSKWPINDVYAMTETICELYKAGIPISKVIGEK